MSYSRHHAIIVTCSYGNIEAARQKAIEIFNVKDPFHGDHRIVSEIMKAPINMCYTFMIGPDGSAEYWEESMQGDERRKKFIAWLEGQAYEDGSNQYAYVEIQYGDERGDQKIINASNFKSYDSNDGLVPFMANIITFDEAEEILNE